MKQIKTNQNSGFTLIEFLIYMAILSILVVMITQIFTSILDAQLDTSATSHVQQDSKFIIARLQNDIMLADTISTPATVGAQTTTLVTTKDGQNYTYALNGGKLQLTDTMGTDDLNGYSTTISNLTFTRLGTVFGKNTITINFDTTSTIPQTEGLEAQNIRTTIGTR